MPLALGPTQRAEPTKEIESTARKNMKTRSRRTYDGWKTRTRAIALQRSAQCQVWPTPKRFRQTSPSPTVMYDPYTWPITTVAKRSMGA